MEPVVFVAMGMSNSFPDRLPPVLRLWHVVPLRGGRSGRSERSTTFIREQLGGERPGRKGRSSRCGSPLLIPWGEVTHSGLAHRPFRVVPWGEVTRPWGEVTRLVVIPWGEVTKLLAKNKYLQLALSLNPTVDKSTFDLAL
jgi:hypothetical protein